jgi:hypothetical protein
MTWRELRAELQTYPREELQGPVKIMYGYLFAENANIRGDMGEVIEDEGDACHTWENLLSYLEMCPDEYLEKFVRLDLIGTGKILGQAQLYCFEENYYFCKNQWFTRGRFTEESEKFVPGLEVIPEGTIILKFPYN